MAIGRAAECLRIDDVIEHARRGRAAKLVLEGEAGIGKTTLLDYAEGRAEGFEVLKASGVQTESQLAYSGLLSLVRSLQGLLDGLPGTHASALRAALGLSTGDGPTERLFVGAGVLDLLAAASMVRPVLVLVDDLHWLDTPSVQALLFALRRLDAEPVAALVAVRTAAALPVSLDGLARLVVTGLDREAMSDLLSSVYPGTAPEVVDRLHEATGGNPLAVAEIAATLTRSQRAGREALVDPLPTPHGLQSWYEGRIATFEARTREALLVAAVAGDAGLAVLASALAQRNCATEDLDPAVDAGLLSVDRADVRWRHQLVRSAVYHAADPPARRAAHQAVAAGLAPGDPAWAWHRVAAATGPDDCVAEALDRVAADARARSGFSTAAAAAEQAAALSSRSEDAQRRALDATDDAWLGGDPRRANRLLDDALPGVGDEVLRGRMLYLRGYSEYAAGDLRRSIEILTQAATLLSTADGESAARALGEAVLAGWWAGEPSQMVEASDRLRALVAANPTTGPYASFAAGMALMFGGRHIDGGRLIEDAVAEQLASPGATDPRDIWVIAGLGWLGRSEEGSRVAKARLIDFRRRGVFGMLPRLLRIISSQDLDDDRWADAEADATEGLEWSDELGQTGHRPELLAILATVHAWRGDDDACSQRASEALAEADAHANYWASVLTKRALGVSALGRGRYAEAAAIFDWIVDIPLSRGLRGPTGISFPDLVESLTRLGRDHDAATRAAQFEDRFGASSDPRASPLLLRCRALTDSSDSAGQRYVEAVEAHAGESDQFIVARTQLLYGEWLRRSGQRRHARENLNAALEAFESYGAAPWMQRARDELRASGVTLQSHPASTRLTPAEQRVAVLAAEGLPTKELCAQLYLSQKTIETHLGRVYRKLGVRNRTELARKMLREERSPPE